VNALTKIVSTWVLCPVLAAVIAMILYKLVAFVIKRFKFHMFKLDRMTRYGLLLAGVFGSYSLGANNIANVMGVFVPVSPFSDVSLFGRFNLTGAQQLFFIGGVAIAVGVFTYSKKVMMTVGEGIMELSPVAAFVAVWSHSIVLFLFSSQGLESFLTRHGLPSIPLVPVSSSQAIVGAVIGMGLLKGGKGIRWRTVGGITTGWITTPLMAALMSFVCLFFLQNVFQQKTYRPVRYVITQETIERIRTAGVSTDKLEDLFAESFPTAVQFKKALSERMVLTPETRDIIMNAASIAPMRVTGAAITKLNAEWFTDEQVKALKQLEGREFVHKWQLNEALAGQSPQWRFRENDRDFNRNLRNKLAHLYPVFRYEGN
jgi:PiT family inorganic phosphate transporter